MQIGEEISYFAEEEDAESGESEVIEIIAEFGLCWHFVGINRQTGQHYRLFAVADGGVVRMPFTPPEVPNESEQADS